jgi:two-component system sensor histidine kinase BarA
MRLIRISLATKYRILFGLAVVLIIAAALSVPWTLMAALVYEQPYREAQRIADDYFRLILPEPAAHRSLLGGIHGRELGLLPEKLSHEPQFIRFTLFPDAEDSAHDAALESFVSKAFRTFIRRPQRTSVWEQAWEDGQRRFQYAHAVRVTRGCLSCHAEGRGPTPYSEGQLAGVIAVSLPAGWTDEQVAYARAWLVGAGVLAGILAILVFYVITRWFILSPIDELRGVSMRVAEGDLEVRSRLETGDEFEQLSASLNLMLERLRASQEELKRANRLLDQKLGEMAETNVALYESNRLKSEFLANVTHELRTPLTSIIGFAELLREGPAGDGDGKVRRYAENILISGRILLEIVNDLLDLAKIEANKVELKLEPVRVEELCETLVEFVRPLAGAKRIEPVFETSGELPLLITDRGKLRQILFNLLSNAVKYSPEGGQVQLTARRLDEHSVELAVIDSGPGIAPENRQLIFEKFRQVDQSATRAHHGTGLGLAIARELAQLLGGQLDVESELGRGSKFWVKLPIATSEPRERPLISLV